MAAGVERLRILKAQRISAAPIIAGARKRMVRRRQSRADIASRPYGPLGEDSPPKADWMARRKPVRQVASRRVREPRRARREEAMREIREPVGGISDWYVRGSGNVLGVSKGESLGFICFRFLQIYQLVCDI